ncbi:carboxymuconolactone decarboxylase family protein [Anditalea andensis]|uniref:Alkylhydroperoxidase n=1 Tax=Anditalea andensis TaxID=1048983 RepID=A0A074L6V6_9BACT|nr:carboxymuconolactone decarboxylase family protein [Anditalea andensis]KEO75553.1 alkylhydroperoxidase [Anditalea andensis]
MKNYKLIEYDNASSRVKEIYDDTKKTLGVPFVLNWFKCQGNNPTLLSGNWAKLKSTLCEGEVPNIIKQLIIYKVSSERNCTYCAEAHRLFANMLGKDLSNDDNFLVTENLDSDQVPHSYKVAVEVVSEAALKNGDISQIHFDKLLSAGFNSEEIQELFAQADLVNMLNTIANVSGIKVDAEIVELSLTY